MSTSTLVSPGHAYPAAPTDGVRRNRFATIVRGRESDDRWVRPLLIGLLVATGILYIWGLGASGYANSFYSAAAQAGGASWKAMFFGSSDASNSITVDKPPAALWIMALSVRIFGLNSWSILVPQALEGVASVGLLYLAVRRTSGAAAGLIAGVVLAVTPVAALMFRFNNPDSLLVLLLIGGAYCLVRALENGSGKWLSLVGVLVGFGFLTKMLQSLLVVPAFALVYLVCAPNPIKKRITQLLLSGAALIVSAGWWIAIVSLVPAADRPYIGGSQNNSILELTLGYNGFGRLTGNETGSVGGGATTGGNWGATGITRLFGSEMGAQISWLLPTALILLVAGLFVGRKAVRTDRGRAGLLIWGGWLVVTGLVFSFAKGIIHPYYTVALAPAVGGVIGIGAVMLWKNRHSMVASILLSLSVVVAAGWQFILLDRTSDWMPWLRYAILVVGVASALLLLVVSRLAQRVGLAIALIALVGSLAGPTAYAVSTAKTPHTGSIPSAGPSSAGGGFGGGGRGGFGGGTRGAGGLGGGTPPTGGFGGGTGTAPGGTGTAPGGTGTGTGTAGGGTRAAGGGGAGGLLNATTPSAATVTALKANASQYTWVAAAIGSNNAAGYQLATEEPVMAIGGFNGSDPSPTLAQFKAYVAAGKIHYFIASSVGGGGQSDGSNAAASISTWIEANFKTVTVGSVTMYDLTQPNS